MKRTSGFTLLELLIAIAITALVMAMVGGILVSTLEADQHVADALQVEKQGYGCLSLLRRDLEACYSYALGAPAFKGERGSEGASADRISFVTATEGDPDPQSGRRPKLEKISYRLKQNADGGLDLYRAADPYTKASDDPLTAGTFYLVCSGLKSLKLSYLDPKDKLWKDDEWKEGDRIPLAVRISVELTPSSQQQQPQGFGLNPGQAFQGTVGLPSVFAPLADQEANTPPK